MFLFCKSSLKIFLLMGMLFCCSCKKFALLTGNQSALEAYFAENVINQHFIVSYASDSSVDITNQYAGYDFMLLKDTSFYNGTITGTKNGIVYSGSWTSNNDYGKLIINLTKPTIPAAFIFLNRQWKFTKKDTPVLKLAPWGSADPKILFMRRL